MLEEEHQRQSILSLECVDDRGTGGYTLAFFTGIIGIITGPTLALLSPDITWKFLGVPIIGAGLALSFWAFKALPKTKYYTYFQIDKSGIYYLSSPEARTSFMPWEIVQEAKRSNPWENEVIGLELILAHRTGHTESRLIPLGSENDVHQAMKTINHAIALNQSTKNPRKQ